MQPYGTRRAANGVCSTTHEQKPPHRSSNNIGMLEFCPSTRQAEFAFSLKKKTKKKTACEWDIQ